MFYLSYISSRKSRVCRQAGCCILSSRYQNDEKIRGFGILEEQEAEINSGSIAMSSTSSRGEQKSNDRTVQNPSAQPSTKRRNAFNVLQEDDEEDELETYPSDSSEEETKSSNEPESTSADVASPSAVVIEHSELVDTQIDDMSRSSVSKDMEEEPSPFSDAHSTTHILSCDELLACFHRVYKEYVESQGVDFSAMRDKLSDGRLIVGMVGYPNVGKSATINAMFGEKKVAVAPTPGKTKHFQTLNLTDDLQVRRKYCNLCFFFYVFAFPSAVVCYFFFFLILSVFAICSWCLLFAQGRIFALFLESALMVVKYLNRVSTRVAPGWKLGIG